MNIKIIKGRVSINNPETGWHDAGIIADALVNWPQFAEEIEAAIPAYEKEVEQDRIAAEEKKEARRLKELAMIEEDKLAEIKKKEAAEQFEKELKKRIDDAVAAALATKIEKETENNI